MLTYQDIYNLQIGDVISFPANIDDIPIIEIPGDQFFMGCYKNGNPYWFPVIYLRGHLTGIKDNCYDDEERVLSVLNTTIKVTEILNGFPQLNMWKSKIFHIFHVILLKQTKILSVLT